MSLNESASATTTAAAPAAAAAVETTPQATTAAAKPAPAKPAPKPAKAPAPAAPAKTTAKAATTPASKSAPAKAAPAPAKPVTLVDLGPMRGVGKSLALAIHIGSVPTEITGFDDPLVPKDRQGRPGILRCAVAQYLLPGLQQVAAFNGNLLLIGDRESQLDALTDCYGTMLERVATASFDAAHTAYAVEFAESDPNAGAGSEVDLLATAGAGPTAEQKAAILADQTRMAAATSGLNLFTNILAITPEVESDPLALPLPQLHAVLTATAQDRSLVFSKNQQRDLMRQFDTLSHLARNHGIAVTVAYVVPLSALTTPGGATLLQALHQRAPIEANTANHVGLKLLQDPTTETLGQTLASASDSVVFTFAFGVNADDEAHHDADTDSDSDAEDQAVARTEAADTDSDSDSDAPTRPHRPQRPKGRASGRQGRPRRR